MARDPLVAQNYAQALFNVTRSQRMPLDDALREAKDLRRLLESEPKLRTFYEGPQFREEAKEELTTRVLRGQLSPVFYQFIVLLLRHNRIANLMDVLDEFETLVQKEKGITPGTVTTAVPVSDDQKAKIQETLESSQGKKFNLVFKVDPKLIGGVRVQYGDVLIDSSLATYLTDLRRRLSATRIAS